MFGLNKYFQKIPKMIVINFVSIFVISIAIPYPGTIKVDPYSSDLSSRKKLQREMQIICDQWPAEICCGIWVEPHSSWAAPSQCMIILGVLLGPEIFCSMLDSAMAIVCTGIPPWIAEAFSELHYSLCNFLHNLSFSSPFTGVRSASWSEGFSPHLHTLQM